MARTAEEVIAGALLGTFAGDARRDVKGGAPSSGRDGSNPVAQALQAAEPTYTDETQLALALAEHPCEGRASGAAVLALAGRLATTEAGYQA